MSAGHTGMSSMVALLEAASPAFARAESRDPMTAVREKDRVRVHYTGKLTDGTVFDSSREREPIEFEVGAGQMIAGFDRAVLGMALNETKTFDVPASEAYGDYDETRRFEVSRTQFPTDLEPQPGQQLALEQDGETAGVVVVLEVSDESVTLDANHPLAGKDLVFDIEIEEILRAE